ncbi:DNA repair protein RecO [Rubrolithibacter danxiaensis]|uniref:DNA repair protein RecO n=1 Tax=Rubrolithibacter danxiaensis TaxID=3390805 RepID=UPI003BF7F9FD
MLHKTRGIVLKSTNYSESSVVVQIFTEKFGIQSYLINGVKKPKAKIRNSILQPLHLLDMVVYHKPEGNLQRVAEVRQVPLFQHIPYDIVKSSLTLFLNEVLYKSLKHQQTDEQLFDYIFHSVELLDKIEGSLNTFHLHFLLKLTRYLGFYPDLTNSNFNYFDLKEGIYSNVPPPHPYVLDEPYKTYWEILVKGNIENLGKITIPVTERRVLLERLLDYYRLHIDGFDEIKSHHILEEVLN